METVGLSPKAIAASIAALLTPLVVAFVAEHLDTNLDVNLTQAIIGSVVTSAIVFVAARFAKPGVVVTKGEPKSTVTGPNVGGGTNG